VENRRGSYEAFLKLFDPDAFAALVVRPARRRAGAGLAVVLALAVVACCILAAPSPSARHAPSARGRDRRPVSHADPRHFPGHDAVLGEVVSDGIFRT
jgi:hypothetical protein